MRQTKYKQSIWSDRWVHAGLFVLLFSFPGVRALAEGSPSPVGAIVSIHGEISDVTLTSIQRRVEQARERGATTIIFELDTPGGMVTSALDICDYIKNLSGLKTIAWVNTQAYSAGSMIAMACDEIVMSSASTIGDCGVILGTPMGAEAVPEELRAKAESPVLEQFRDSARRRGYSTLLCEALVVKEREVWWVENTRTGEREFVDGEDKNRRLGEDDESDPERAGKRGVRRWKLVETYHDPISQTEVELQQPVDTDTELLTMNQSRAYALGFSKGIVSDVAQLQTRYGLSTLPIHIEVSWSERFVAWLTSMPVRAFLLLIVFLGAYVEFNTPGVGLPGLVALIGLAIFVGAPYLTGLANIWEVVAVILGIILIAVELFVIPGFGVAGVSGMILLVVGLLATFIPEEPGRSFPVVWPSLETSMEGLKTGLKTLAIALTGSIVGAVIIGRNMARIPYLRDALPENPTPLDVATDDPYDGLGRIGDIGVTESQLRPVGKARFSGALVDVVTEGELVDQGARVEVIERRGNRVVVRLVS